jgi:hypothetical protein
MILMATFLPDSVSRPNLTLQLAPYPRVRPIENLPIFPGIFVNFILKCKYKLTKMPGKIGRFSIGRTLG